MKLSIKIGLCLFYLFTTLPFSFSQERTYTLYYEECKNCNTSNQSYEGQVPFTTHDISSDFVFENDYKLKSLNEIEEYIKNNKHLPEIPSAQQMQEEGININELQIKLLQKIEELTLYVIEQQKRIEQLEEKIK